MRGRGGERREGERERGESERKRGEGERERGGGGGKKNMGGKGQDNDKMKGRKRRFNCGLGRVLETTFLV